MARQTRVLLVAETSPAERLLFEEIHLFINSREFSVKGLFVVDEALMKAGRLPDIKEVLHSGEVRALTLEQLNRDVDAIALQTRSELLRLTDELGYAGSFEIVRGMHNLELARAAAEVDFVVLARAQLPGALRSRTGRQLEALDQITAPLLIVNEPWSSGDCVIVAYGGSKADRALALGVRYAQSADIRLLVAVPPDVAPVRSAAPQDTQWITLDWNVESLSRLCSMQNARLLIFSQTEHLQMANLLPSMMDRVPCSILRLP